MIAEQIKEAMKLEGQKHVMLCTSISMAVYLGTMSKFYVLLHVKKYGNMEF